MKGQTSLLEEITVDGFCGGGGWSTGFELAIGRPVDVGINHDAEAIALHKANHPYTKHYQTNIFEVDPVEACQGRTVGWAHFSPDCKHFSRAKGAKPVSKEIRSLAWVVLKWASEVHPRIISIENVPEFVTWGPLVAARGPHGRVLRKDGTEAPKGERTPYSEQILIPDKKRIGETFQFFIKCLRSLGYTVEWNELVASDYGAPTSRKRFFLVARMDKKQIVWPAPTHGDPSSKAVKTGELKPWHTAAEIIDWSNECPSIFERKKPLAENTLRRIARGIQKYVIDNPEPFIVQVNHTGENFRGQELKEPMPTITAKHGFGVVTPIITQICQNGFSEKRSRSLEKPLSTIVSKNEHCIVTPYIMCNNANNTGRAITEPVPTVTTGNRNFVALPTIIQYHTEKSKNEHRGQEIEKPLLTVDAAGRYGIAAATIIQFNNNCAGRDVKAPIPTITAQSNHFAEVRAMLIKFYGCGTGQAVTKPLDTITAKDRFGLVTIKGEQYQIVDIGLRMLTPRELYDAQGFPHDYQIETDCYGRKYPKKEQVARCGNAVPPAFAVALVQANAPEWCKTKQFETMKEWNEYVAGD